MTASIWRAPSGLAARQQLGQQQAADALALRLGRDVDRILETEAIGAARPEVIRIGIAEQHAVAFGHEPGQALAEHVLAPAPHLGFVGRLELEGAAAVPHVVRVDGGDRRDSRRPRSGESRAGAWGGIGGVAGARRGEVYNRGLR